MIRRALAPVLAVVLVAGCGGSSPGGGTPAAGPSSASASPSPSPTPELDPNGFPLADRPDCAADAGGDFVRSTTSEGNGVAFLLLGSGTGGVVLGPQSDGDICQWLPYAQELATHYRVALFGWKERSEERRVGK